MKMLARMPLLLAAILALPLWITFDNFIVAAIVALLLSFLIAMCRALYMLTRPATDRARPARRGSADDEPGPDDRPGPGDKPDPDNQSAPDSKPAPGDESNAQKRPDPRPTDGRPDAGGRRRE